MSTRKLAVIISLTMMILSAITGANLLSQQVQADLSQTTSYGCPCNSGSNSTIASASEGRYPLMRPDPKILGEMLGQQSQLPQATIDPQIANVIIASPGEYFSILNHLCYIPAQRNQGGCGNCWVWASTGVMEIALYVQKNYFDRLSIQNLTSCLNGGTPSAWACCGGGAGGFANYYNGIGYIIPWSNTNANWQDGSRGCASGTGVPCSSISAIPRYTFSSCAASEIPTHNVPHDTAIANIKSILLQEKGIYFGFCLPTGANWSDFFDFWDFQPETAVFDLNAYGYQTCDNDSGCHAVLCVGWNDTDPNNAYWIMVNSWGSQQAVLTTFSEFL